MSAWDTYRARMTVHGNTERERALNLAQSYISNQITGSLSYKTVCINGLEQQVSILNQREDMAIKKICALPNEKLIHGGLVDFADCKWLITDVDANDEVYATGMMRRCNYLLKWLDVDGKLIEKWCVVEDGTKYLIGEKTESMMSIGDARIAITIARDADTIKLVRGKRFLVGDVESGNILAYQITKPNHLYNVYDGEGVFRYILNEVNVTDDDNISLCIADYYNWTPYEKRDNEHVDLNISVEEIVENAPVIGKDDEKEVWL